MAEDFEVDSADRIINRTPPRDPADMSEANAEHYMTIWDRILSGLYRSRAGKKYATEAALFVVTGKPGEIAYVEDGDQFWRWNVAQATWTPAF